LRPLEIRKYLFDIDQACSVIESFTSGKSFEDYEASALLRSAVERQFEIVGEALGRMIKADASLAEHVSHSGRIIGFRNRLIHG
jgi:uncharacterized protein with HEPN domain